MHFFVPVVKDKTVKKLYKIDKILTLEDVSEDCGEDDDDVALFKD